MQYAPAMTDGQDDSENTATDAIELPEQQTADGTPAPPDKQDVDRPIENPLLAYVEGGTPTQASERLFEERFRDGEQRRNQAAIDQQLASKPIERGGAKMYSHRLTEHPDVPQAYLLLHYVGRGGSKIPPGECLADVFIDDWSNPSDLTLGIMCPACWTQGVKHGQDCQLKIRMSNRGWHLEPGKGAPEFIFNDGGGAKKYKSAGVIVESEVFGCSDCSWRARIVNNQIRSV